MGYKKLPNAGLEFEIETFDPELKGKYLARYRKFDKRKVGHGTRDGWLIWPVVNGHRHHEFFSDFASNNSPAESLLAAVKRRDEVLAMKDPNALPFSADLIGSNFSGRNGVSFTKERYKTGAKGQKVVHQSSCWCATWTEIDPQTKKKRVICKKFSIKKNGFIEGYKLAVLARWNWENEMRKSKGLEPQTDFGIQPAAWMKERGLKANFENDMQAFAKSNPLPE